MPPAMPRLGLALWALFLAALALAEENPTIKSPSPDSRFALRIIKPADANERKAKADLIEQSLGQGRARLGHH